MVCRTRLQTMRIRGYSTCDAPLPMHAISNRARDAMVRLPRTGRWTPRRWFCSMPVGSDQTLRRPSKPEFASVSNAQSSDRHLPPDAPQPTHPHWHRTPQTPFRQRPNPSSRICTPRACSRQSVVVLGSGWIRKLHHAVNTGYDIPQGIDSNLLAPVERDWVRIMVVVNDNRQVTPRQQKGHDDM